MEKIERRLGRVSFSSGILQHDGLDSGLLQEILEKLPDDAEIVRFFDDPYTYKTGFIVESEQFKVVPEACIIPEIIVEFTREFTGGYSIDHCEYYHVNCKVDLSNVLEEKKQETDSYKYFVTSVQTEMNNTIAQMMQDSIIFGSGKVKLEYDEKSCEHQWKDYQGLTESYKYCSLCDQKDKS